MKKLHLDIWSDIACPWCYVGKRRLEAALTKFAHRDDVEVTWRAFELDPKAPAVGDPKVTHAMHLARKYGRSPAQAEAMLRSMTDTAAADGLTMRFDIARLGNTFDGHRLIHLALTHGKQDAMKERLFRAYMTEGQAIGDHAVLVKLGVDVGLDEAEVRAVLASDRFTAEVRQEEADAREMGINGVPFFVVAEKYGVSGAQSPEALLQVLTKAWSELPDEPATLAEGAVCGPDGCA